MVISAETASRPAEPAPMAAKTREDVSGGGEGGQNLLHNLSFPILKTWGNQRLLRCANVNRNGEAIRGGCGRRSAAAAGARVLDEGIELEEVRKKLLIHLREAADRITLAVPKEPDQEPDPGPDPEPETETEPSSTAAAASRPWNLRARRGTAGERPPTRSPAKAPVAVERRAVRLRSEDAERKCRPRFLISLSVDEIEEDIYAVTGSSSTRCFLAPGSRRSRWNRTGFLSDGNLTAPVLYMLKPEPIVLLQKKEISSETLNSFFDHIQMRFGSILWLRISSTGGSGGGEFRRVNAAASHFWVVISPLLVLVP